MGELISIWIKRAHRGVMDPVSEARLVASKGLVGNANQGGRRQVTIIDEESWATMMDELDADVPAAARRANLLVRGLRLAETRGRVLQIGAVRFRIAGETRPCERMDEALPGLRTAMSQEWRGGVFAQVLDDGEIRVGETVEFLEGVDETDQLYLTS
jgi:MOSC domain-containing protein YiiM